jgi:DNA-binding MarR family transcriptional regulator
MPSTRGSADENVAELAHELRLISGELHRRLRADTSAAGLTATQFSVLARLERDGPASAVTLAAGEHVTTQAAGQCLAALEREGLIVRRPHATDGRQLVAETTVRGRRFVHDSRRTRESWIADTLSQQFAPPELRQLTEAVELLRRLVDS